jgi:hypothetical protein
MSIRYITSALDEPFTHSVQGPWWRRPDALFPICQNCPLYHRIRCDEEQFGYVKSEKLQVSNAFWDEEAYRYSNYVARWHNYHRLLHKALQFVERYLINTHQRPLQRTHRVCLPALPPVHLVILMVRSTMLHRPNIYIAVQHLEQDYKPVPTYTYKAFDMLKRGSLSNDSIMYICACMEHPDTYINRAITYYFGFPALYLHAYPFHLRDWLHAVEPFPSSEVMVLE